MSDKLIKLMREQRMSWLDLDADATPQKRVRIIRPTEYEMAETFVKGGQIRIGFAEACRFVVDWQGFSEADLLGAAVGSSDPLPFTQALWAEVLGDHIKWVPVVTQALMDAAVTHQKKLSDDAKN